MANLRFYTDSPLQINTIVQLSESAAAHASKALRLEVGDEATLFNGDGFDYRCTLTSVKKMRSAHTLSAQKKSTPNHRSTSHYCRRFPAVIAWTSPYKKRWSLA